MEREVALNSSRMKKTQVLIALGAFFLLTMLIAESESIGNLIPSGKRQLQEKVCIHQTAVLLISKVDSTQHLLRTRGRTWITRAYASAAAKSYMRHSTKAKVFRKPNINVCAIWRLQKKNMCPQSPLY